MTPYTPPTLRPLAEALDAGCCCRDPDHEGNEALIQAAVGLAVRVEREACAGVAKRFACPILRDHTPEEHHAEIAAAIRARGPA